MKLFSEVNAQLIAGCQNGIYVYQCFAERVPLSVICGKLSSEDYDILLAGPDHDEYIEVAADLCNSIEYVFDNGRKWLFFENDGNIWLYPAEEHDNINWDEFN